ncbi:MAG: hypothetical protein IPL47_18035 [Phyllobacteriaceae bacterium]|nr:hypothetical protein [Phyllobacteriaceae bacterium]
MMSGSSYAEVLSGGVTESHPDIVTDDVLTGWMDMAAAKNVNVTLVVDGCHGGGLLDREFANVSFIGGSAEDQIVPEVEIDGRFHGAVSEAFARAIEGEADFNADGFVTQTEMDALVAAAVETRVEEQADAAIPAAHGRNHRGAGAVPDFPTTSPRALPHRGDRLADRTGGMSPDPSSGC